MIGTASKAIAVIANSACWSRSFRLGTTTSRKVEDIHDRYLASALKGLTQYPRFLMVARVVGRMVQISPAAAAADAMGTASLTE